MLCPPGCQWQGLYYVYDTWVLSHYLHNFFVLANLLYLLLEIMYLNITKHAIVSGQLSVRLAKD